MELYRFLALTAELVAALEAIEQRHEEIEADLARLSQLRAGNAMRSVLTLRLRKASLAASADHERAVELLHTLSKLPICS